MFTKSCGFPGTRALAARTHAPSRLFREWEYGSGTLRHGHRTLVCQPAAESHHEIEEIEHCHPQSSASHLLGLQGPQQTPAN